MFLPGFELNSSGREFDSLKGKELKLLSKSYRPIMGPIRPLTQLIKGPFLRHKSSWDVLIFTDHHLIPSFIVRGVLLPAPICITDGELMKEGLIFLSYI